MLEWIRNHPVDLFVAVVLAIIFAAIFAVIVDLLGLAPVSEKRHAG